MDPYGTMLDLTAMKYSELGSNGQLYQQTGDYLTLNRIPEHRKDTVESEILSLAIISSYHCLHILCPKKKKNA